MGSFLFFKEGNDLLSIKEQAYQAVDAQRQEMLNLWEALVNIECGPGCKSGIDAIGFKLAAILEQIGCQTRFVKFPKAGNTLIGELGDVTQPFVALIGHMDTVFHDGTAAARPFKIEDGKAYGPGVLDMKGGIVILVHALQALQRSGYAKHPIKIILVGDEEIGHRDSEAAEVLLQEAAGAMAAFNFETGFLDDGLVVERKGMYQFILETFGRGAHVGNDPENGRSAIKEIAHKVLDIEALTDFERGTTFNVGVITGGTVCNATPAYAKIDCDMRFIAPDVLPEFKAKLQAIAAKTYVKDTTTKLTEIVSVKSMPRLPQSMQLFELVKKVAAAEGLPTPYAKAVGGASDSAYMTAAGVPTVCAMGVKGARNHTDEEFAVVESLFERTKLMIAVLLAL